MRAGDILGSPHFWILTGICVLCGWYAKRNLVDGIIFGGIAPLILAPVWFVVTLALAAVFFPPLNFLVPELIVSAKTFYERLPETVAFLLFPSTVITAILFLMFCRMERSSAGLPSGYRPKRSQTGDHNPFSRSFR